MKKRMLPSKKLSLIHGRLTPASVQLLQKKRINDYAIMEGRPTLKGSRSNCRLLAGKGIRLIWIADNMAGFLFYKERIKEVWLAYHMFDKKGAFCETGGLILAVLAKRHRIPVRLLPGVRQKRFLAPVKEIIFFERRRIAPKGVKAYAPLLEWIPMKYIKEIYT